MKKPTVTIGIPAYNEEANIKNLLNSILKQNKRDFKLDKIIVISDGSTDSTVKYASEVKDKRIKILDFKKRQGKSYHLDTFPKTIKSDILVLLDGDVELAKANVISSIIKPIIENNKVGLVSANFTPTGVNNFLQKSIKSTINVFEVMRNEWKGGNNAFGCTGRIQALSKKYYNVMHVPHKMVLNDIYTYFDCLNNGFEFRHVKSVNVKYQLPDNIHDYLSQYKRFCVGGTRMEKIFGKLYTNEYAFPKKRFYKLMFKEFLKSPLQCLFIFALNKIGSILASKEIQTMNGKWEEVKSTKNLYKYAAQN